MNKLCIYANLGIVIGLILISGCKKAENLKPNESIKVVVQKIATANEQLDLTYSGTIEESMTIPLNFSSIGTVASVLVSEGTFVRKGTLLAKLDNRNYKYAYEMALATERQAEDAYRRLTPMHQNKTLPEIKYVEVATRLEQAKSAMSIAKKNLDDCDLYATTDGYIGKRAIEPGMVTAPNITPITLIKIDKVFARVSVPENEIASIKKGEIAQISVRALNAEYAGIVEEIGVSADLLSHTYKIKIAIANKDGRLKPGMICSATLHHTNHKRGLAVPSQAVLIDETGNPFIYVVDQLNQKAIRKYITVAKYIRNGIEATGELNENDLVVVEGQHKLTDHAKINIIPKRADEE